ncbi:hypothetical protein ES319_D10G169800v1 [Gossypium barbadense]|uniref:F-box domain-containing protein n=2 Tax=Gossypium TaxID=3633 RepID=A0A5J5PSS7_GOSBA|nr:hypothetical protein ES319_D10G169800v1 [Gossypium barbadense]TYG50526.1 hypothetical protein ES288_D10G182400v1 [Gossypium darwinii]
MSQSDYSYSSLPKEISLKIASSLEAPALSSLACCSRDWQEICVSDCLWKSLLKERWPLLCGADKDPNFKDWRGFYVKQHEEQKRQAESVINLVEQRSLFGSLNAVDYLHAISCLERIQLGFRDVQMLLLKPELNVLLNLIGLHYCLNNLQVPAFHITEALWSGKIADRQVCVKWRSTYNFRTRGGDQSRCVYLKDLVKGEDDGEVLTVLERGATYELSRVQVSDPFSGSGDEHELITII